MRALSLPSPGRSLWVALAASPVLVIFVSSNVVNAGNLLFNVLFSRWMGPEIFGQLATLLTLKLALLGVLGALQMAISQRISSEGAGSADLAPALSRLNRLSFIGLWLSMPLVLGVLWASGTASALGIGTSASLLALVLGLPFAVPLSLLRGVALGRLNVGAFVLSANAEMLVRLLLATFFWHAGYGLTGVALSISLSICAGWLPLANLLPKPTHAASQIAMPIKAIALMALPFAVLQGAQVLLLDADVIIATLRFGSTEAGLVAALSLFQRIQFFACFGLAGVLLPTVSRALAAGQIPLTTIASVLGLVGAVFMVMICAAAIAPELLITLLVGEGFIEAAPALMPATAAAAAFTLSYLGATVLAAMQDRMGIWLLAAACVLQIAAMANWGSHLTDMLLVKLACQLALAALIALLMIRRIVLLTRASETHRPSL